MHSWTPTLGDDPEGFSTVRTGRFCLGCGRDISSRSVDAKTCSAACRQRARRDRANAHAVERPKCVCGHRALAVVDVEGDLVCAKCGRVRSHVEAPFGSFDATAWLMTHDGDDRPLYHGRRRVAA